MVPVYCQFLPACKIIRCTKENEMVKIKALNCKTLTDAFDKAYDFPVVEDVNIANKLLIAELIDLDKAIPGAAIIFEIKCN